PALATSLQFGPTGATAVSNSLSATSTLIDSQHLQLTIPAVNVNTTIWEMARLIGDNFLDNPIIGLSYVALGEEWLNSVQPGNTGAPQSYTFYTFGYETPASAVPTTGTAVFSGTAQRSEFAPVGNQIAAVGLSGDASLSVDFAAGKLTGAFTQMKSYNYTPGTPYSGVWYLPWNDVSLSASIAAGTNKFSGTTAATSNPQSAYSLPTSVTGYVTGAFYGPNAQELGAIWTLSDGKASAIGGVAASSGH